MFKRTIAIGLVLIGLFTMCSCGSEGAENKKGSSKKTSEDHIVPKGIYNLEENVVKRDAKLIVNGKDISEDVHIKAVLKDDHPYFEIPFLTIVRELGAEVEWKTATKAEIYFDDNTNMLGGTVYILEADKLSFKEKGIEFDMFQRLGGYVGLPYFCLTEDDYILSDLRCGVVMKEFGVYMNRDFENLCVTISQRGNTGDVSAS